MYAVYVVHDHAGKVALITSDLKAAQSMAEGVGGTVGLLAVAVDLLAASAPPPVSSPPSPSPGPSPQASPQASGGAKK